MRAQGATEYLVLLAVVLIVALVSVALLGFFPGMASDAQITQSRAYWQGAQPVSIVESGAAYFTGTGTPLLYIRLRNSGAYPIRVTGLVGGDGNKATQFAGYNCGVPSGGAWNISDYFYLGPGEERYFASGGHAFGTACEWTIYGTNGVSNGVSVGGASSLCQNSNSTPGTQTYNSFGFEYMEYIEGQQITKREIGKPLIIKCLPPTS